MRTSSAKAKGRRLAQRVKELIEKELKLPEENIFVTPSGCTGEDLIRSELAKKVFPWAVECKNQEALNVWAAIAQAKTHGERWALFFSRNREDDYVVISAKEFLQLVGKASHQCECARSAITVQSDHQGH